MSVYNLAFRAGIPLGALALGKLIPLVGVSIAIAGCGGILILVAIYFMLTMRDIPGFSIRTAS